MFEYFIPTKSDETGKGRSIAFSVKEVREEQRRVFGYASTGCIDRSADVIPPEEIKKAMPAFMKNPVLLAAHTHQGRDGQSTVIGKIVSWKVDKKGLWIEAEFAQTSLAEEYWSLYKGGFQKGFSIGFNGARRNENREGKQVWVWYDLELYEISCCAIPCNPETLAAGTKGFVHRKRIEREKQQIMNDDDAFCKLVERFEQLQYEYGDPFGNIPADSDLWDKFTAAETAILKELESIGEAFGEYENKCRENGLYGEIGDGPDDKVGGEAKASESNPGALSLVTVLFKE